MAVSEREYVIDLKSPTRHIDLGELGVDDNNGTELVLRVPGGGVSGHTITAYMILADGSTVAQAGSVSGEIVTVTIPDGALSVPGRVQMAVRAISGSVRLTLVFAQYTAKTTRTDVVFDPGTILPSIDDLLVSIDAAEKRMDDVLASIPEDYSEVSHAATYAVDKSSIASAVDLGWEQGAFNTSTGAPTSSVSNLRTIGYVYALRGSVVRLDASAKNTHKFAIVMYKRPAYDGDSYIGRTEAVDTESVLDRDCYIRIHLTRKTQATMSTVEGRNITAEIRARDLVTLAGQVDQLIRPGSEVSVVRVGYWSSGTPNTTGGSDISSSTRIMTRSFNVINGSERSKVRVDIPDTCKARVVFYDVHPFKTGHLVPSASNTNWTQGAMETQIPEGAVGYRVSIANADDSSIDTSAAADCTITETFVSGGEYAGKRISIIGDSISTFAGYGQPLGENDNRIADGIYTFAGNKCRYPQASPYLLTDVHDTYWMRVIDALGLTLGVNESWAGSLVSWDGKTEDDTRGRDKHIASKTRVSHLGNNGAPDIIMINAGTNDVSRLVSIGTFDRSDPSGLTDTQVDALPVNTFCNAYRTLLIRIQRAYPTSRVFALTPDYARPSRYHSAEDLDPYCAAIREICAYFGVPVIDARTVGVTLFNRESWMPDGIHYGGDGMAMLAAKVKKFLLNDF